MITSEALEGVPILVLANKQDVEVRLLQIYFLSEQLSPGKVSSAFMLNLFYIPVLILSHFPTAGNNRFELFLIFFLSPPTLFQWHKWAYYGHIQLSCFQLFM